ncbi:glycosyltransferase family 4 protein [Microbacterium sp. NE2HP2]|uniref:glycosyltransferase family 4 protein n=1 Tax=Microbacterium plantarum TaxID=1816425 RepID=UPI0023656981|nr:glycosyltransferase family 4 protein [Microbacterium plantarum]MDD7945820.1 glycosyltransferase family 4 protein [Microbacterium plantarum]
MAPTTPLSGRRVAILVQNLPVPFDRRVWMESMALAEAGADVTVVCPADDRHPAGEFTIEGIKVFRYRPPREASGPLGYLNEYAVSLLRMRHELRRARRGGRFDVIHFCNPPDLLYTVAGPFSRRDESILVFDQHDLGPELVEAKHMPLGRIFTGIAKIFESRTYASADHVIATNESYKQIAIARGGFTPDDVTVVRSGPVSNWGDDVRPRDWHNGHEFLLGYVGVMGRQEGIEYLLEAIAALREWELDVHLSLVGSGPDRSRLEILAASLGITDNVTFHGRVSDEDLKSILSDADVCVNPDEVNPMNNLSTMNKIVEYMALGRPIVQFDVKEGKFSAGGASSYAEANSAQSLALEIRSLLQDPEMRAGMSQEGIRRFKHTLCWEHQAGHLVDAYVGILDKRPRFFSV